MSAILSFLKQKIESKPKKRISFYEYMNDCLYHPHYGYYMTSPPKIGKEGDYYTSSSVHPVFAEVFVELAVQFFNNLNQPVLFCEMGAGTGRFARQFLDRMQRTYRSQYESSQYILIEKSPANRKKQALGLQNHREHVHWRTLEEVSDLDGIFFSNELVDAFPVHLIEKKDGQLHEIGVAWDDYNQCLSEVTFPLENDRILTYIEQFQFQLREGQRMEIPLDALDWSRQVAKRVNAGLWITVDYGYTNEELMFPQYHRGSLRCYNQHRVDQNPLEAPGEKDITSHVHFDAIREAAALDHWQEIDLYSQADFLLRAGILSLLEGISVRDQIRGVDPFQNEQARKNRAINQLITPGGIGSAFQVLVLAKGVCSEHTDSLLTTPFKQ